MLFVSPCHAGLCRPLSRLRRFDADRARAAAAAAVVVPGAIHRGAGAHRPGFAALSGVPSQLSAGFGGPQRGGFRHLGGTRRPVQLPPPLPAQRTKCRAKCQKSKRLSVTVKENSNGSVTAEATSSECARPPGAAILESDGDLMESGTPAYSALAAPGDGRTPPKHYPAVTDPL